MKFTSAIKASCRKQFKNDFFDIEDKDKNDTLYYDVSEDAHNQLLIVMLLIKPASIAQLQLSEAVESTFQ